MATAKIAGQQVRRVGVEPARRFGNRPFLFQRFIHHEEDRFRHRGRAGTHVPCRRNIRNLNRGIHLGSGLRFGFRQRGLSLFGLGLGYDGYSSGYSSYSRQALVVEDAPIIVAESRQLRTYSAGGCGTASLRRGVGGTCVR